MDIVVVESPAKAKTINKYLGPGYEVLASYGHVRDLPPKDGSVRPDADFEMSWSVDANSKKHLDRIVAAMRNADRLILATDPDREGEAISWHVQALLEERKALKGKPVQRVVFHEITRDAVLDAMARPRELNRELVEAYLARRALDYLVGFTLSPVLWRKLPGSRSAGRVQSVALRLVCEREAEIEAFRPQEYWSVEGDFQTRAEERFTARLTHLDGKKLDRLSLGDKGAADAALDAARTGGYRVVEVEKKTVGRHPAPPFTTSTLQQEANRKLGFGASRTMQLAQRLYEGVEIGGETVGLITYMRTDSVTLSGEAIAASRRLIERDFGARYVPEKPRVYRSKAKNAQEAHEAIRPTDLFRRPNEVARYLDDAQARLYALIWQRTVASAMESAVIDQTSADLRPDNGRVVFRATGSVVVFDGFLRLYQEGRDEAPEDEGDRRLPALAKADPLALLDVRADQHFTQPPPRYTEASLVKKMEELGIGRPSTYASILRVLQDRNYVRLERRRFTPEERGRLVTAFLTSFFSRYVEYGFTADLEQQLDDISGGRLDWKEVLRDFWRAFSAAVEQTKDLKISDVIEALDGELGPHFFPADESGSDAAARLCPTCKQGRLSIKLGKFGPFIGCSNYPECRFTRQFGVPDSNEQEGESGGPRALGTDPETGQTVTVRHGPYGHYIQLGEDAGEAGDKNRTRPKRATLPKGLSPGDITLEHAIQLLALPREVGIHPGSGKPIVAGIGRFGPYLKHGASYVSLGPDEDVLTVGQNRAITLVDEAAAKRQTRDLGEYKGKPVCVQNGRFGAYVKCGRINATLPKGADRDAVTLDDAIALIEAKSGRGGKKQGAAKPAGSGAGEASAGKGSGAKTTKTGRKRSAGARRTGTKAGARSAAKGARGRAHQAGPSSPDGTG